MLDKRFIFTMDISNFNLPFTYEAKNLTYSFKRKHFTDNFILITELYSQILFTSVYFI